MLKNRSRTQLCNLKVNEKRAPELSDGPKLPASRFPMVHQLRQLVNGTFVLQTILAQNSQLPRNCNDQRFASVWSWRVVLGDPGSKAHSRFTFCRQGNQRDPTSLARGKADE